jgi:uncharacterized protein with PQ loop repeat
MRGFSLTYVIFVIAVVATLPQLYQTLETRKVGDFSLTNLILNDITNILFGIHGYITGDTGLILIGVWFTAYWTLLLGIKLRFV